MTGAAANAATSTIVSHQISTTPSLAYQVKTAAELRSRAPTGGHSGTTNTMAAALLATTVSALITVITTWAFSRSLVGSSLTNLAANVQAVLLRRHSPHTPTTTHILTET